MADIYKKEKNFRRCFLFLYYGNEFIKSFDLITVKKKFFLLFIFNQNPDILNLCAKMKLSFATYYFEFG